MENFKSKYNPKIHNRKRLRMKGHDYSWQGLYFVTICCQDKIHRFGEVVNGEMILNEYGRIAHDEWEKLVDRFPNMQMDEFQIMPNHVHGIVVLKDMNEISDNAGAGLAPAPNDEEIGASARDACSLSDIIGAYKSLVANRCLEIYKEKNEIMGKLWQRSYHDVIIRDEQGYHNISNYIIKNPENWERDKLK